MIGQWSLHLVKKQVPELQIEPYSIAFHFVGEFITAIALLIGGIGLLIETCWSEEIYFIATGMLIYTVIVSPGYFAQKGDWRMVGMFAVISILTLVGLGLVLAEEL